MYTLNIFVTVSLLNRQNSKRKKKKTPFSLRLLYCLLLKTRGKYKEVEEVAGFLPANRRGRTSRDSMKI